MKFVLAHQQARQRAIDAVRNAQDGYVVTIAEASKNREQEEKYHAMITEIAQQCMHLNRAFNAETWKRMLVDQFKRETLGDPEIGAYWRKNQLSMIPSLDGSAMVVLGEQTRKFPKKVASAFIEFLYAFGNERDVKFNDRCAQ